MDYFFSIFKDDISVAIFTFLSAVCILVVQYINVRSKASLALSTVDFQETPQFTHLPPNPQPNQNLSFATACFLTTIYRATHPYTIKIHQVHQIIFNFFGEKKTGGLLFYRPCLARSILFSSSHKLLHVQIVKAID